MIDGYEYQKQKRREQKEWNEKNRKPMDETTHMLIMFIVGSFVLAVGLIVLMVISEEDNKNNCEKIDGEYVVVDRQWVGKSMVDVYGCVK